MEIKVIKTGLLQENTYVISRDGKCLVIDPGSEFNKINDYISSKGLIVEAILLTHGHYDHISAAEELSIVQHCNIYASFNEKEMIEDANKNGSLRYNRKAVVINSVIYFDREQTFNFGDFKVDAIFLPGHSPGGVGYIIGDVIFTGDTLFKGTYGRVDLYGGNKNDMVDSLKYLFTLDSKLKVYPGHGDATTIGEENIKYNL